MGKEMKMKTSAAIGYGLGSLGKDLALGVIGSYLLIFYTDILGISAAAAGVILVATKIWDAVNDPMMGAIVDRTNSRFGRFRPYILFVPVPLAVFSALCFVAPDWSAPAKVIYAAITYTVTGMLFTAYDVPLWGMVPSITDTPDESNRCISAARFFTSLGMFIAMTFAYPLIERLGGGTANDNLRAGYPRFMILIGILSVVFAWVAFSVTKEKPQENQAVPGKIFGGFLEIIRERNVMVLFLTMMLHAVAMIVPNVVGTYYMIYYWGRPDLIAVYFAICSVTGLATAPLTAMILKKMTARSLTLAAMGICLVLSAAAFVIPAGQIGLILTVFALFGLVMPVPMVTVTSLLVEEGHGIYRKTGVRKDGILFSLNSFAIKCGTALASAIVSVILSVTKYNAAQGVQAPAVLTGINAARTIVIAFVYLAAIIIFSRLKQDGGERV